ncbi:unnamed protein product [Spirodela intermedia]|uniref:Uncharacterized protein n=2 Tax=Spirodela intermedia TaxID=51605 RepID=A0A7I8L0M1_SPIIN|nr:unnamed protein product [Spirodela intermedia]CAA6666346.1 unnamed protein product [Spirodela intermedia]CAA7403126.1 unnamed protein product [Spirodela intermedia]
MDDFDIILGATLTLNNITMRNKYSIPNANDLFD